MVTTTFKESARIERMTNDQVATEITDVLRTMFPDQNVTRPTEILFPRWLSNPLFHGSYSNWPVGMSTQHHDNVRAPLPPSHPRLWFAGEATSSDYYGYLHGAWYEGKSVGESVYKCITSACPPVTYYQHVTNCNVQSSRVTVKFRHGSKRGL